MKKAKDIKIEHLIDNHKEAKEFENLFKPKIKAKPKFKVFSLYFDLRIDEKLNEIIEANNWPKDSKSKIINSILIEYLKIEK